MSKAIALTNRLTPEPLWRAPGFLVSIALALSLGVSSAYAQNDASVPSQGIYDREPQPIQRQQGVQQRAQPQQQSQQRDQDRYCLQLEQKLANDWVRADQGQNDLPRIDQDIRKYDQIDQNTQAAAERADCYQSLFIFGRSLRRTPRCTRMNEKIEDARRQLARLQEERKFITRGRQGQGRKDDLINALARSGCGQQYAREARRRQGFFSWFSNDRQDFFKPRRSLETSRIVPFATYRTLCVRLCDGYYFPINYSALPSQFPKDANACQKGCAAPARLYVYRNPGEETEQMVSVQGSAYNDLKTAWRYRKEYVKGCSCKEAEFDQAEIDKANTEAKAEGTEPATGPGDGKVATETAPAKTQ